MTRRLSAVMFTDLVGSTELAQRDEPAALEALRAQQEIARPLITAHHGRWIKSTGDGLLAEFTSALEAVECAVDVQRRLLQEARAGKSPPLRVRIGVHLGDVVEEGDDILGDAVNIAARVQGIAEPGGIALSRPVYDQISNKVLFPLEPLGPRNLKGVARPMEIYRVVLSSGDRGPGGPVSPPPLERDRVAVLPFVNISPDPNDEFFADGLTEELMATLTLVPGLKVIARTSVMSYKRKEKSLSVIGQELGSGTIVEGSVRKSGNRIRVTVHVTDANTEQHLSAASYDAVVEDLFQVQREIAEKVCSSLPRGAVTDRRPAPAPERARSPQAYLAFLEAQANVARSPGGSGPEALLEARRLFEEAIRIDPGFARGYLGKGIVLANLARRRQVPWAEGFEAARHAALQALKIEPDLADAHALLAIVAYSLDEGFDQVEERARRALELNPSLGVTQGVLSLVALHQRDLPKAVRHAEEAYRLEPLSEWLIGLLGTLYLWAGRRSEAIAHLRRAQPFAPVDSLEVLTDIALEEGDLEEAERLVRQLEQIAPERQGTWFRRGLLLAYRGDRTGALDMARKLGGEGQGKGGDPAPAGAIYYVLGDRDRFFEAMFAAIPFHTLPISTLLYSSRYAEARGDPRFRELLARSPDSRGLASSGTAEAPGAG
jgi:class 3 adenylate cyclase/TolB-like protein/Flp pilus assembly protein TadD